MNLQIHSHRYFMQQALFLAEEALQLREIPVGAVVVCKNKIIAKAYNQTERLQDVTAHAEILALTSAQNFLGSKYLTDCTLYVTLEPCVMCAGALFWAQLGKLVWGASDEKRGFTSISQPLLHPKTSVDKGLFSHQSENLIKEFFKYVRD